MSVQKTESQKSSPVSHSPRKDRASEIANTFEWLITAFILAFVFRAFVMEAFRIPTGSMADTLMGAHFQIRCQECGYEYNRGFVPDYYNYPADYVPNTRTQVLKVQCPSCGYTDLNQTDKPLKLLVSNGDRILVLKCMYQFVDPKRWDVIVFKNPSNPSINYIKRLVGLPGETVEIVDGDLFINGKIMRKPPMVQRELWMPIYDNDYQPVHPELHVFNGHSWTNPFNTKASLWQEDPKCPTQFVLNAPPDQVQSMPYDTSDPSANGFEASYAYNSPYTHKYRPICSDLMIRFHALPDAAGGFVGAELSKYGIVYHGRVQRDGTLSITRVDPNGPVLLTDKKGPALNPNHPTAIRFCLVDQRLILICGSERLVYDLDGSIETRKHRKRNIPPTVAVQGAGQWTLSHVALYRDIHYTGERTTHRKIFRATEGHPFTLHKDEFFVLGDNSPNSEDARWWDKPTVASRGYQPPRLGIVPRKYLVGKAMFVYWPSGFEFPWPESVHHFIESNNNAPWMRFIRFVTQLHWIPNIGKMRFIYGGSDHSYVKSSQG